MKIILKKIDNWYYVLFNLLLIIVFKKLGLIEKDIFRFEKFVIEIDIGFEIGIEEVKFV